jgi:Glycosyltransferase family 92
MRFGSPDQYLVPQYKDFQSNRYTTFDSHSVYGNTHILPKIRDSGRWENIPICLPSLMQYAGQTVEDLPKPIVTVTSPQGKRKEMSNENPIVVNKIEPQKKHRLVSCIWASAGYTTRGSRAAINDGQRRLLEWITYNSIIGFDHIYVYDNSGAFSNDTSLRPVTDLFSSDLVTYIPWPSQVCNNNPNNVDSVGERSSQYAAESSCRLRFGPHVDWIGQFDIDEYLVPMGEMKSLTQLLDKLEKEDTRIISFASWRAWPRRAYIDDIIPINDPVQCWSNEPCFDLKIPYRHPMLQAYNCDRQKPGEKQRSMPAEKQLYRPDYVLQHFVHYSVATVLSEKNRTEYEKDGFSWRSRAFPDPRQRFGDERTEGLMIHTKSVARQDTAGYNRMCHINNTYLNPRRQGLCRLGIPYPPQYNPSQSTNATPEGYAYNCYVNEQVEDYLIPKLIEKLKRTANFFTAAVQAQ